MQTGLCRHVSLSPATCHPLKIHGPCHAMPCPGWQCLGPTRPAGMTMGQAGPCWPTGQKPFSFKSLPKKQQYIITYSLQVILTFFSWDIEKETVVGKRGPTLSFFAVSRKKPMAGRNPLQGNQPAHCSMILHLITTKPSSHTNQLEPRPCTYPVNPTKTFNYSSNPPTDRSKKNGESYGWHHKHCLPTQKSKYPIIERELLERKRRGLFLVSCR